MVLHCEELLTLSLDLEDFPHSGKAFSLIMTSCDDVFRTITDRELLTSFADRLLQPGALAVAVNRFAMISREVILFNPVQTLGIERFLPFIHCRSVFEMFGDFLTNEDRKADLQESLKRSGFVGHVLAEVDALPTEGFDANHAELLFKLVLLVAQCKALADLLYDPAVTIQLFREFVAAPKFLLNAQWEVVLAVTTQHNLGVLGEQIGRILLCIGAGADTFSPYQVTAIRLAQKVCNDVVHRVTVIEAGLPAKFEQILTKFNCHTIAQTAITEFVVTAAKSNDFGLPFLERVLPIAAAGLREGSVEQRGFALNFLRELKKVAPPVIRKMVPEEDIRRFIELNISADRQYGGSRPRTEPTATPFNLNPQLINMLMQLVQNPNRGP
jgi:hypothetical protein